MADLKYNSFKTVVLSGVHDFTTDTYNLMLVTSSYTPTTSHSSRADVTNEVSGTGYTAGGQAISGISVSLSGTEAVVDFNDVTWASSTKAQVLQ